MKIILQNLALEYQDEGSGKVILFLHGWQDNLRTFEGLAAPLSMTHRIVRLDLPGFGQSEVPSPLWNLDNYIETVKDFIQKTNLEIDTIIGHSFGGRIIIKGIASGQLQANKIILIGSAGLSKSQTGRNLLLKLAAKLLGLITYIPPLLFYRKKIRRRLYTMIGSDYLDAGALQEVFKKVIAEDLSSSAAKISQPTLLIWGENDAATPLADGRKLAQLIGNSKLEIIRDAGHFVHREKPQQVLKLIRKFIC